MVKNILLTQAVLALALSSTDNQKVLLWDWLNELAHNKDYAPVIPDGNHADMLLFRKLCTHLQLKKSEGSECFVETAHVISYLNEKVGTKYDGSAKANVQLVTALIREGYTVADFLLVIDYSVARWQNTIYASGLRPAKLFNSEEFKGFITNASRQKNQPLPAALAKSINGAIDAAADDAIRRAGFKRGGLFPEE